MRVRERIVRDGYGSAEAALASFARDTGQRPLALVIVGENGCERIWLDKVMAGEEQCAWAAKHVRSAADTLLTMEEGAGHA